jgi:hypothetical protein
MVGEPLAIASIVHLFPDVLVNVLVLIPTMIWSMYLLYKGIPVVLDTPPERGMLMASSLLAWLLVAAVSLLGISMALWTAGVGPLLEFKPQTGSSKMHEQSQNTYHDQ